MKYLSVILFVLVFMSGCAARQYDTPVPKFKKGDLIRYKGSNIEGMVVKVIPIRNSNDYSNLYLEQDDIPRDAIYLGNNYYRVSFATKNQIGIDTAATRGMFGSDHYDPTFIAIRYCEEFELEKRE